MRGLVGAYRGIIENRALARLFAAFLLGALADWVSAIALLVLAWQSTDGDPVIVGIVGAIRVVPYIVLGVPAGYVADRFDRRRVLLVSGSARVLSMAALAAIAVAGAGPAVLVVAAMLATTVSVFFQPAIGALLPSLIRDERELGPANAVYASVDTLAMLAGPAVAAILLAIVPSVPLAFAVNAAVFALAVLILRGLPARGGPMPVLGAPSGDTARRETVVAGEEPGEGGGAVAEPPRPPAARPIAALLVFELVHSFVIGALVVITAYLAFEVIRSGDTGTAALNTALGAGGAAGVLAGGVLVLDRRVGPPFFAGVMLIAGGLVAIGWAGSLPALMVALFAVALGSLVTSIVGGTAYQRMVPDEARGRMLAALDTIWEVIYALGAFLVPSLLVLAGIGPVVVLCAGAILVTGVAFLVVLGPWGVQPSGDDAIRAHLSRVPAFAALSPARLTRAEQRASIVRFPAGTPIIRQGGPADRFFAIAAGEVEVTRSDAPGEPERVLRRMGVDEGFGEIGILARSPRTATVTALTDVVLVALDARDFLRLVGVGEPGGPAAGGLAFPGYR